ncbi:8808_t:CDS:2 [Racocetra persica]|uniref:8808_t:CDS:1 n=1 Tax=Racocetra persica TaxID=160502 RepID=A0ACA9QLH0_9GLOM|nr:8808_t:CDS:2 [Racocetra persica]
MTTLQHIFAYHNFLDSLHLTILFGNTPTNPKEIYFLDFLNVCADSMLELNAQQHEDFSERKLLRSLLGNLNEQEPLHNTRLHLLIKTSRKNSPPELIPKQLLKLKFAKTNTLFLICEGLVKNLFSQDDDVNTRHESSDDDLIWYHFKTTLNGFAAI